MKELYASIDLFVHLSASEAGSNVVAETLSYGIPTLVLDASTNPTLFKGGAIFVESEALPKAPYETPKTEDLYQKLKKLVEDPKEREEASRQALAFAQKRFAREHAAPRIDLMTRAAHAYFHKTANASSIQKEVEAQFEADRREFL
jgi:glycosyltransferase involved in cell wall biosynthesis